MTLIIFILEKDEILFCSYEGMCGWGPERREWIFEKHVSVGLCGCVPKSYILPEMSLNLNNHPLNIQHKHSECRINKD